jgi:hypothetical protein
MNKSEQIGELAAALAKAQGQMGSAHKDASNPFFKSKYADLSSIVDAIKGPLSANGIAYVQTTDTDDSGVLVETTLIHSSGQWISGSLRMRPVKDDPQGIGSCITYARRYGLQAIVGLDADDDDGNAASGNNSQPKAQAAPRPAAATQPPAQSPDVAIRRDLAQKIQRLADELHISKAQIDKASQQDNWTAASVDYLQSLLERLQAKKAEAQKKAPAQIA